jgi:hypothetical protein
VVDRRLRHAVDRLAGERDLTRLRAEVDDRAAALGDHRPADRLADEERALEIDRAGEVEVGLGHVLGRVLRPEARVVDEDVDAPGRRERDVDGTRDLIELRDIHLHRDRMPAEPLDLARHRRRRGGVAQAEHDIRPGMRECERDRLPQAARGAGDEGDSAREVEAGKARVRWHAATVAG